jgi:hypothetical protein
MVSSTANGLGLSGPVLILVIVAGLAQVALQVAALVSLYRAPAVVFGNKWIWAAIIIVGSLVGSLVFFIIGRNPEPAKEPVPGNEAARGAAAEARSRSAVDLLYGDKEQR